MIALRRLGPVGLVCTAALGALAGCGASSPTTPPPLGITDRLPAALGGLPPQEPPTERRSAAGLAGDIGLTPKLIDALSRAGLVSAAARSYRKDGNAGGLSVVVQTQSPRQARTLMRFLTRPNAAPEIPHRVQRTGLVAIPGSVVTDIRFTPRREPASEIVLIGFTDGPFVYFEQSSGYAVRVDMPTLERDVIALDRRVRGRPAPELPLAD